MMEYHLQEILFISYNSSYYHICSEKFIGPESLEYLTCGRIKGNTDWLHKKLGCIMIPGLLFNDAMWTPKIEMHIVLNSGKRFVMALLNYFTFFQNIKFISVKHYML